MPKQNITFALFDIRPVDPQSGRVNFDLINNLKPTVNLKTSTKKIKPYQTADYSILPVKSYFGTLEPKDDALQQLQVNLSKEVNFEKELESFGGKLVDFVASKRKDEEDKNLEEFRDKFSQLHIANQAKMFSGQVSRPSQVKEPTKKRKSKPLSPPPFLPWASPLVPSDGWGPDASGKSNQNILDLSPAARDLDIVLTNFKNDDFVSNRVENFFSDVAAVPSTTYQEKPSRVLIFFSFSIAAVFLFSFFIFSSLNLKNSILQRSNQAYINLSSVQDNLSEFNFFEAASSFSLAARNFELLQKDLKKASSILGILDTVTLGGVSNTSDLIKAGELISQAGLDLANALEKISGINLISVIQQEKETPVVEQSSLLGAANILEVLSQFRINLIQASRNLNQAYNIILESESNLISDSERGKFEELKLKLPEFSNFIEKAANYSSALTMMLGQSSPQQYLVLFQNSSEIRPTGGFPGSYALVKFDKGVMQEFFVDDIYNPDGQMKEKIIPPRPLQKITPNWGMRDANWFNDFPASAKKVAEFYYKDTKNLVDGVVAVNVGLIPKILKITGPIEMADFGITLSSENFIAEVQKEVEYERTKGESQPKQILVEFAPKFLEKLSGLSQEDWMKVFAVLVAGIEEKDIMTYFVDSHLEGLALENGFAGEIKNQPFQTGYLMITHSNIMGSKTDAVIDNFTSLTLGEDSEGNLIHSLEIERLHNGGDLGFYNKRNNDYVRVLMPEDAELVEVIGNDPFEIVPLLNYQSQGFVSDPDLERYESKIQRKGSVEIFEEGGKKVIAFWMIIEPGQSKKVIVKYKTPKYNSIYFQKQPGIESSFKLIFNNGILFDGNLSSDKNIVLE